MPEATPCPQCHWGYLIYPVDMEEQRCVGCRGKARLPRDRWSSPTWPYRTVYRSGMNEYGQEGVIDDD